MKKKALVVVSLVLAFSFILSGCKAKEIVTGETEETVDYSNVTSELNAKSTSLETPGFYVQHDGSYYPLVMGNVNYKDKEEIKDETDATKQMYFSTTEELTMPTLFLGNNDKLIFYDPNNVLDYAVFKRHYDLGYTLNVFNFSMTDTGKFYLNKENENGVFIPNSDLASLKDLNVTNMLFNKIGGAVIDKTVVDLNNIIRGLQRDEQYDVEVYDGTIYHHYTASANNHAFREYELFGVSEYTPLRKDTYEVEIPDYLVNGYYEMGAKCIAGEYFSGMMRIVKGRSYNLEDANSFNQQLQFTQYGGASTSTGNKDFTIADVEKMSKERTFIEYNQVKEYKIPNVSMYSDDENINKYKTTRDNALGSPNFSKTVVKKKQNALSTTSIRKFYLELPEGKQCTVKLVPSNTEDKTATVTIAKDKKNKKDVTYSPNEEAFIYETTGDGEVVCLEVSGIWHSFKIELTNATQVEEKDFK